MSEAVLGIVREIYRAIHRRLLKSVEDLTQDQLARRPTPTAHSIAFELWHVARANDSFQARLAGMAPSLTKKLGTARQIWEVEGLVTKWGLDPAKLGPGQVGVGMNDEDAANLKLPGKDILLDYARRAFAAADRAVDAVDETEFVTAFKTSGWPGDKAIGWHVIFNLGHDDWVLGYIVSLRRAQGLPRMEA